MTRPSGEHVETLLPYQYVTLRCVPRVEREEFVNVGVVLYCQATDDLLSATEIHPERLRAVDPHVDLDALQRALRQIDAVCADAAGRSDLPRLGTRFGWIAAPRSTVVQPGPRHGGLTLDPRAEVTRLLGVLVAPPA